MAYHIYFVDDPVVGPTHGQKSGKSSELFFKSMGFAASDPAPAFTIVFEPAFDGKWTKSKSDNPVGSSGVDNRTWVSQKVGKYQQVKITLKSGSHPTQGYKYSVTIGANTWDPRVVPK